MARPTLTGQTRRMSRRQDGKLDSIGLIPPAPPTDIPPRPEPRGYSWPPLMGFNGDGSEYYNAPRFASALRNVSGEGWSPSTNSGATWGAPATIPAEQFNDRRLPISLSAGQQCRFRLPPYSHEYNWLWPEYLKPPIMQYAVGLWCIEWRGNADVRMEGTGVSYVAKDGASPATGNYADGKRYYMSSSYGAERYVRIYSVQSEMTALWAFLPDPAKPSEQSLEGKMFFPGFVQQYHDVSVVRGMNFVPANSSTQKTWSTDRRIPDSAFGNGIISDETAHDGLWPENIKTRSTWAWEWMVAFANEAQVDLWINIPHLANNEYITKLAKVIRYGSDGYEPYESDQANPVWAPLNSNLKVWIEYSNEMWNSGSFSQAKWAEQAAILAGIPASTFVGRRMAECFSLFQAVWGTDRIVRICAVRSGNDTWTQGVATAIRDWGATLTPAVTADVAALETYYGSSIEGWVNTTAKAKAGTADQWYTANATTNASISGSDPYWTSAKLEQDIDATFYEWNRRQLAGIDFGTSNNNPTGLLGGFRPETRALINSVFGRNVPLCSYEGGQSIYTTLYDVNDSAGNKLTQGITWFFNQLTRRPKIKESLAIHMNGSVSKGLYTVMPYKDVTLWSKFGQWGQNEYWGQNSERYQYLMQFCDEMSNIRHIDYLDGTPPTFTTAAALPLMTKDVAFSTEILASAPLTVIGAANPGGLVAAVDPSNSSRVTITGTPTARGAYYAMLRAVDAAGNPAWRVFSTQVVGGSDVLFEVDFRGTSPALNRPWTQTYYVGTNVTFDGVDIGVGVTPVSGNNEFIYWQANPNDAPGTLANAIANNRYIDLSMTLDEAADLRGCRLEVSMTRSVGFHAPKSFSLFCDVVGFLEADVIGTAGTGDSTLTTILRYTIPSIEAYAAVSGPVAFRLYSWNGRYSSSSYSMRISTMALLEAAA
jgi:hypothetical protein